MFSSALNVAPQFERPTVVMLRTFFHHLVGVLTAERRAVPVELPSGIGDPTPIALPSFSTVPEQRGADMLQRALDALEPLPVHVVATTGGIVDPADLVPTSNAHLVPFAGHDDLMKRASFVVGHGGHGTNMRALLHGLSMVGTPATVQAFSRPETCASTRRRARSRRSRGHDQRQEPVRGCRAEDGLRTASPSRRRRSDRSRPRSNSPGW